MTTPDTHDIAPRLTAFGEKLERMEALAAELRTECLSLRAAVAAATSGEEDAARHLAAVTHDLEAFHVKFERERARADDAEARLRAVSLDLDAFHQKYAHEHERAEEDEDHLKAVLRDLDAFHRKYAQEHARAEAAVARLHVVEDVMHRALEEETAEELKLAARELLDEIIRRAGPAAAPMKAGAYELLASMFKVMAGAASSGSGGKAGA